MKKNYNVQRMTIADYNRYMCGSNTYRMETIQVEANTPKEAVQIASKPGYVVNENYVKTTEEIEAERAARNAEYEQKEQAAAEQKAQTEAKNAANMGMTIEEYKEYKRCKRNAKAHENEIRKALEEIARLQAEIEYHTNKAAEWRAKM